MLLETAWYNYHDETDSPKYVRLYFCIRREIERGNIPSHYRLPSIRQISGELGLSKTTVENAYNQLNVEGYIYSIPQKGYFTSQMDKSFLYSAQSGRREKEGFVKTIRNPKYMDEELFDFHEWKKTYSRVLEGFCGRLLQEGNPQGETELRDALCVYAYRARGIQCNPDQIVIGAGVQTLLHIICDITEEVVDKKVAFEEPGFTDVRYIFQRRGFCLYPVELEEDGINIQYLFDKKVSLCFISPSHQYPTGLVMPIQKRMELLYWAAQVNGYIMEDDYDSELRFSGRPVPSLFSLDNRDRVIYIGSFSTALMPSLRISYMILPDLLMKNYKKCNLNYRSTVSAAEQLTLALFINGGHYEKHLRKMRKKCSERLRAILREAEPYKGIFNVYSSDTGTFVLLESNNGRITEIIKNNGMKMGLGIRNIWGRYFVLQFGNIPENLMGKLMKEISYEK